jgi:GTP cyclohydrolase I
LRTLPTPPTTFKKPYGIFKERSTNVKPHLIEEGVKQLLLGLEVELTDPNFKDTPVRFRRFLQEMFQEREPEWATFEETYSDFILLKGHKLFTLCPHHLLPVELVVSVAYIPNGKVLGLSKLARLLHESNRGPILQEKFTKEVLKRLQQVCEYTAGCAVLVDGQHGCTKMRGVKSDARFLTYRVEGAFDTDTILQQRFFTLARA